MLKLLSIKFATQKTKYDVTYNIYYDCFTTYQRSTSRGRRMGACHPLLWWGSLWNTDLWARSCYWTRYCWTVHRTHSPGIEDSREHSYFGNMSFWHSLNPFLKNHDCGDVTVELPFDKHRDMIPYSTPGICSLTPGDRYRGYLRNGPCKLLPQHCCEFHLLGSGRWVAQVDDTSSSPTVWKIEKDSRRNFDTTKPSILEKLFEFQKFVLDGSKTLQPFTIKINRHIYQSTNQNTFIVTCRNLAFSHFTV